MTTPPEDNASLQARQLALSIARCPIAMRALRDPRYETKCREIIETQHSPDLDEFQLPEPWSGHIGEARVLFISSNPSFDDAEDFPRHWWSDDDIYRYFDEREHSNYVQYWVEIRARAQELFQRVPVLGNDYALTEVVHCKSQEQRGVRAAVSTCMQKWFEPILKIAAADILVVIGDVARDAVKAALGIPAKVTIWGPQPIVGRLRYVAFLPAPSSSKPRKFAYRMADHELTALREFLRVQYQERMGEPVRDVQADPDPEIIDRYLRLMDDPLGRAMIAYLSAEKGRYYTSGAGADPSRGVALKNGSDRVRNARGSTDAAASSFIRQHAGYMQNQENYERGVHTDGKARARFMRQYGDHISPYTGSL